MNTTPPPNPDDAPAWVVELARNAGGPLNDRYRVVVLEGRGGHAINDFERLEEALAYADDVASESDVPWSLAYVFGPQLRYIRRGRHYAHQE